jgi:hypothetical protein
MNGPMPKLESGELRGVPPGLQPGAPTCELDQWVLNEVAKRQRSGEVVSAMLVGIGADAQAKRLAEAGARVLLFSDGPVCEHVNVVHQPLVALSEAAGGSLPLAPFDLIVSQRTLSPFRYGEARQHLRHYLRHLKIGGKLFISLYGIHSELGDNYPDGAKLVYERLAPLAPELARRHGIDGPVCLYSERNLFSLLMEAGLAVLKTSTSALGHVRGVAARV